MPSSVPSRPRGTGNCHQQEPAGFSVCRGQVYAVLRLFPPAFYQYSPFSGTLIWPLPAPCPAKNALRRQPASQLAFGCAVSNLLAFAPMLVPLFRGLAPFCDNLQVASGIISLLFYPFYFSGTKDPIILFLSDVAI